MSFFSFGKKTKAKSSKVDKEAYSIVFNIGSGSVSGGIIKFTEASGENVLYYAKELIPFQQELSIPKHLELMKNSLGVLTNKIQTEGLKIINSTKSKNIKIDRLFYVFASPWSISQTKTIRIKEPKVFKVTDKYLSHIIEQQEKEFQTEISKAGKIIEKKIIQIKSNGYIIDDYKNIITKDLEITVFFTVVSENILQEVENAVSRTFQIKEIWCHSLALSIFTNVRDLFPQKEDFIHIDISEEITDISIIKDNIIASTASIPFGRNNYIRELSAVLNVPPEVADSMIKMHCQKSNDQLATLRLAMAMDTASKNWLAKILEIFESLREKIFIPESIFLIANCDLASFLKEKLEKQDFEVTLIDNKKIRSNTTNDDIIFRLELMFLDNFYKI